MLSLWGRRQDKNKLELKNNPAIAGAVVMVWEKDPTITEVGQHGITEMFLVGHIEDGPKDAKININSDVTAEKNEQGDFIYDPAQNPKEFDAVNTFSYIHRTHAMYSRVLKNLQLADTLNWQWGEQPIQAYPDAGVMMNAYYSRQDKCLKFFHFQNPSNNEQIIYTCRAEGVVSHETGHAVLDAICPGFMESYLPQTGGLHESFGDITSIFVLLNNPLVCEQVIVKSKCNLEEKDLFLPILANQFGDAIGQHGGLRNANNNLKLSQVGQEVHGLSQVFTGAIYDVLAAMFRDKLDTSRHIPAETLQQTAHELMQLLVHALMTAPKRNASYADIANQMMYLTPNASVKKIIKDAFEAREVNLSATLKDFPIEEIEKADYSQCSATLQRKEFADLRAQALEKHKAEIAKSQERYYLSPIRLMGY